MRRPPFGQGDETRDASGEAGRFPWSDSLARWWRRLSSLGSRASHGVTKRRLAIGGGVIFAGLVTAALAFGPIVRSRVAKEAERRNLDVSVDRVRPGFFAVELGDVRVRLRGVDGIEASLANVRVDLTAGLSLGGISVHGGDLRIEGEPEDLLDALRRFRGAKEPSQASGSSHRTALEATNLDVSWKLPSGVEIRAKGVRASRTDGEVRAGVELLTATRARDAVHVMNADVTLGADDVLRSLHVASVLYEQLPSPRAPESDPTQASNAEPAPPKDLPPTDVAPKTVVRTSSAVAAKPAPRPAANPSSFDKIFSFPDLHAMRGRIATIARSVGDRLPAGSAIDVDGLAVKLDVGGEPVSFGPAPLSLVRDGDLVRVSFKSDAAPTPAAPSTSPAKAGGAGGGTPLSVEAVLPLGAGDVTARLSGGPVSLALLGVREGTKGLFDVGRGTLEGKGELSLSAAADALTFDGQIALHGLSVRHARLSPEPLRGIDLSVAAHGVLDDGGHLRVDDAELAMGALHVRAHGTVEETDDHLALGLSFDVAPAACQALVDSAPRGLLPTVQATRMDGTFGASVRASFDTRDIDKLALEYTIDDRCRISEVPRDLARERFREPFTHRTYHPDGTAGETTTGPGSADWTALEDISPFVVAAVLTTEDGAFYKHRGFNHGAIRNSIAANLKARRFVRGASTITMQLAKNLFLSREKTLSRKIEEVILTDYLEQVFSKDEMMELYLNIVEFGPDVYGVTQAADYYFGRRPADLDVTESFFLAMLLPSPLRYGKLHDKEEVPESWMRHLQALLRIAAKNGKIADGELETGLGERVFFWHPGDPKPTSRTAPRDPRDPHRDPYENDAEWQPVH